MQSCGFLYLSTCVKSNREWSKRSRSTSLIAWPWPQSNGLIFSLKHKEIFLFRSYNVALWIKGLMRRNFSFGRSDMYSAKTFSVWRTNCLIKPQGSKPLRRGDLKWIRHFKAWTLDLSFYSIHLLFLRSIHWFYFVYFHCIKSVMIRDISKKQVLDRIRFENP